MYPDSEFLLSGQEPGLLPYLKKLTRFPMLEQQEEYRLAKRWRDGGDPAALNKLVTSHLRLVVKIAKDHRRYGLPISDLISEGTVGLIRAIERFEPDHRFRVSTYATWWIRASIQEYILRSWSLVKMGTTVNQKKLFFNLRKAQSKILADAKGDMCLDRVTLLARHLGVPEQDVIEMDCRLGGDVSLNAPVREDGEAGERQDGLIDEHSNQEHMLMEFDELNHRRNALYAALSLLSDRERRIFQAIWLAEEPLTLERLGQEFRLSRERIRQINVCAYEKIRQAIHNRMAQSAQEQRFGRALQPCSAIFDVPCEPPGMPIEDVGRGLAWRRNKR